MHMWNCMHDNKKLSLHVACYISNCFKYLISKSKIYFRPNFFKVSMLLFYDIIPVTFAFVCKEVFCQFYIIEIGNESIFTGWTTELTREAVWTSPGLSDVY